VASSASSSFGRTSDGETTLYDVLLSTKALVAHLDRFGVYDMERSRVKLQPVRGGDLDEVELVLGLRERGRLFLKAGTEVGGGEGGGVSSLSRPERRRLTGSRISLQEYETLLGEQKRLRSTLAWALRLSLHIK
jgi:hypothetical protein